MPRLSLKGFKDPVTRPRYIIWVGVVVIGLAMFVGVALAVSSSRLFCGQVCHKVQDDAIITYERGSHSEISCLACHMPVESDTVTFLIHKVEAGVSGAINTLGNTYEMPLNPGSKLALETKYMPERQCTQCHSKNRKVTPSPGILIDHAIHSEKGIACTVCHNRVAHPEDDWTPTLKTVKGEPSKKHPDYMTMLYCYRCHDLENKKTAPGTCVTCHTPDFPLKPADHLTPDFYPKGHAELAKKDEEAVAEREKEYEELAKKVEEKGGDPNLLKPVSLCSTCHIKSKFCDACHGMEIPHPADFVKTHGPIGKAQPAKCAMCHAAGTATATGTEFCNSCHHPQGDKTKPWLPQHSKIVDAQGANPCFECHSPTFCSDCHVGPKK